MLGGIKRLSITMILAISMWACDGGSPFPAALITPAPIATYTLSGVVSEMTPTGLVPVQGVAVNAQINAPAITDANGFYALSGLSASGLTTFAITVSTFKPGYERDTRTVTINSDTRLDIRLDRHPTFTLSGMVSEMTPTGPAPVEGVLINEFSCDPIFNSCGFGRSFVTTTDQNGLYSISGVYAGQNFICATKEGYQVDQPASECDGASRSLTITGDTRFDIQLVRR